MHISKKKCNFAVKIEQNAIKQAIIMDRIDELDRKILQIITQNARIPFKDVADLCGVSRAAVHQRVQKMYDNGVIVGSGYQVNPKMLGYQMCAFVGIRLVKGNMYKAVCEELKKIPEIVEVLYTLGAYSMIVRLYAKDDHHLLCLLNDYILEIPGVANTETMTVLDQSVDRELPIE